MANHFQKLRQTKISKQTRQHIMNEEKVNTFGVSVVSPVGSIFVKLKNRSFSRARDSG